MCGVCLGAPWVFFMGLTVGLRVLWLIPAVSGRTPLRCPVGTAAGTALRSCGIVLERGALVGALADAGAGRAIFPATVGRAGPVFLLYRLSKAEVAVCCCAPACTWLLRLTVWPAFPAVSEGAIFCSPGHGSQDGVYRA